MENLPNLLTAAAPTTAGHRGRTRPTPARGRTSAHRLATAAAASIAVLLAPSCSHSTNGTATSGHTSAPTTAPAAAPRTSATAAPPKSAPASDEDQARDTVTAFNDAYNSQNWEAYTELMCAAMRAQFTGVTMDYVKKGRINNGPATITAVTVTIDGDTATATINGASEALGPGTIKLPLKREDGWKVCQVYQH
jgi:hypothetical protein